MCKLTQFLWIFCLLISCVLAIPKYDANQKAYSNDNSDWRRTYYSENKTAVPYEQDASSTKDRLQRLGYTTGYGTLNGYGASGISAYNPIKLDLGGVVLGTLVGIGAIIIIPKILAAFHGGYAAYGRSENDNDIGSVSNIINKIDDILSQNNIDSTGCMQRAVCSYVRSTEFNRKSGASDQIDEIVHYLSENSLVNYLLDGTAIQEALEVGKNTGDKSCDVVYHSCPLDNKMATSILMKLLPKKANPPKEQ